MINLHFMLLCQHIFALVLAAPFTLLMVHTAAPPSGGRRMHVTICPVPCVCLKQARNQNMGQRCRLVRRARSAPSTPRQRVWDRSFVCLCAPSRLAEGPLPKLLPGQGRQQKEMWCREGQGIGRKKQCTGNLVGLWSGKTAWWEANADGAYAGAAGALWARGAHGQMEPWACPGMRGEGRTAWYGAGTAAVLRWYWGEIRDGGGGVSLQGPATQGAAAR